jgi:hypothetical protein
MKRGSKPIEVKRVILAWSDVDLANCQKGDNVIALTPEAYITARHLTQIQLWDPCSFVREPEAATTEAVRLLKSLHKTLKVSRFPWLEAYANVIFVIKTFQLVVWLRLVRSVRTFFDGVGFVVVPPYAFREPSPTGSNFIYGLARRSFGLARRILEREGIRFAGSAQEPELRSEAFCRTTLGQLVSRAASESLIFIGQFMRRTGDNGEEIAFRHGKIDVALVSEQHTDAIHAVPLAQRLAAKFHDGLLWVGMSPKPTRGFTEDELEAQALVGVEKLHRVSSDFLPPNRKSDGKLSLILDLGSAWRVASLLAADGQLGLAKNDWLELLMDYSLRGFAKRYEIWKKKLDAWKPSIIVGFSGLQDMALVRAWTRRTKVAFVQFMHGVVPVINCPYHVDADYLGVFGSVANNQVRESGLSQPRKIVSCGAMQFAAQADAAARKHTNQLSSAPANSVLLLGGFEWLPFCPRSPHDMWIFVKDIHQLCVAFGKTLRIRPHPRYPTSIWSPYVNELKDFTNGNIELSFEGSLHRDLLMSDFVVASVFDGAAIEALMRRKLVVSYLPEGVHHTDYSRPLEQIGGAANGFKELRELFAAIIANSNRAIELRKMQERYLTDYVGDLDGDHWGKAVSLVEQVLEDVKSTSHQNSIN